MHGISIELGWPGHTVVSMRSRECQVYCLTRAMLRDDRRPGGRHPETLVGIYREYMPLEPELALSVNWKVVGTSCKLKSCKGVFGVQLARSEDSTGLTTETSQESSFVNVILVLMFAFRLLRSFASWFGAEWPKSILQAGYFAVTLAKSNMQDVPTTFQLTLVQPRWSCHHWRCQQTFEL